MSSVLQIQPQMVRISFSFVKRKCLSLMSSDNSHQKTILFVYFVHLRNSVAIATA